MNKSMNEEAVFLSMLSIIVDKYGCKIDDFDFKDRTINISGPKENQANCAAEIASNFSNYLT